MEFDKIVQKMRKKGQKLWSLRDIEAYSEDPTLTLPGKEREGFNSKSKTYKIVHRLVATGILTSIRKGIYLSRLEGTLDPEDFYWLMVKKIIAENYLGQGILSGEKALAFDLRDYSLPETLSVIVPKDGKKLEIFGSYAMIAQHIKSEKKQSLYGLIKEHSRKITVDEVTFTVTCPEHALLEALTTRTGQDITDTALLERWLKKNGSTLRESVFAEFIPHRYISGLNRLKYLTYDLGMTDLYAMIVKLIDQYGKGCHLSREFLRGKKSIKSINNKAKSKKQDF